MAGAENALKHQATDIRIRKPPGTTHKNEIFSASPNQSLPKLTRILRPMSVTADQERGYYDQAYAAHLEADDGALRIDRQILAGQFDDPASPCFERRLLYHTALKELLAESVKGRRVLDYGCGLGDWGVMLAVEGAAVTLSFAYRHRGSSATRSGKRGR